MHAMIFALKSAIMVAGRVLRIFLSSTFEDLREHRSRVTAALERLGAVVTRMETFGALPGHNVAECTQRAAQADALVLLVAHRLGWVPSVAEGGDGRKSITRLEAEAAFASNVPIFYFVVDDTAAWSGGRETDAVSNPRSADEIAAAIQRIQELADFKSWASKRPRENFTEAGELAQKVLGAVANWRISNGDQIAAGERELFDYLRGVIHDHGFLDIRGVAVGQTAFRPRIETLYTPLSCRENDNKVPGRHRSMPLKAILGKGSRILIEGSAGAGKSTFLRLVATMLARDLRQDPPPAGARCWRQAYLGLVDHETPKIPIFLRLAGLVELFLKEPAKPDDRGRLLDLFAKDYGERLDRKTWSRRLTDGSAFLLLDGLDEVPDLSHRQRIFAVFADAEKFWRSPLLVSSRPFRTEELRNRGFLVASIEPFGDEQIRQFLRLWVSILYQEDHPSSLKERTEIYRHTLEQAMLSRPNIRELAANPVMLTCLAVVHWNEGRLPDARARVYGAVIHWLLDARKEQRHQDLGLSLEFAHRTLAALATVAMENEQGKQVVFDLNSATALAARELEREKSSLSLTDREALAERWLLQECENSGVIEELAGRRLRFWHLTFQEYLAALSLAQSDDWWQRIEPHLKDAQWRETLDLFATCLFDARGALQVDRLLRLILDRVKIGSVAAEARAAGLVGRFLSATEACGYKTNPDLRVRYETMLDRTMAIFTCEVAAKVAFETRMVAGEALGRAGDPRLAPGADNYRFVPGTGVGLGIYPVTVEEYRHFVERGGYLEEDFWRVDGWNQHTQRARWLEPAGWTRQLRHPNRPVVGVSLFEAEAYCRWLGRLSRREIRLPTEAEWETAASNPGGPYPWGADGPDQELANFGSMVGDPTPVGIYPGGAAPGGHLDMAGNVCEWCCNILPSAYSPLRGGSWRLPAQFLLSGVRVEEKPGSRHLDAGFRVAVPIA